MRWWQRCWSWLVGPWPHYIWCSFPPQLLWMLMTSDNQCSGQSANITRQQQSSKSRCLSSWMRGRVIRDQFRVSCKNFNFIIMEWEAFEVYIHYSLLICFNFYTNHFSCYKNTPWSCEWRRKVVKWETS